MRLNTQKLETANFKETTADNATSEELQSLNSPTVGLSRQVKLLGKVTQQFETQKGVLGFNGRVVGCNFRWPVGEPKCGYPVSRVGCEADTPERLQ